MKLPNTWGNNHFMYHIITILLLLYLPSNELFIIQISRHSNPTKGREDQEEED